MSSFFNSPIRRGRAPSYHVSSVLRSPRDADATGKQWERNKITTTHAYASSAELAKTNQQLGKLKRRIVGGGSTTSTGGTFKGEWSPTASYATQDRVAFTPDGGSAGMYVAMKPVPIGTSPDIGAPFWFGEPNSPPGMWS